MVSTPTTRQPGGSNPAPAPTTASLADFANRFLAATADPKCWLVHWRNRTWARGVIERCRRPSYRFTVDAGEELFHLIDLLDEVEGGQARG